MTPASILPVVTESHCIWKSVLLTVQGALMENGWLRSQYLSVWCSSLHASWQVCSQSRAVGSQVSWVKSKLQFDLVPPARWGKVRREGAAVSERAGLLSVTKHQLSSVGSPTLSFFPAQQLILLPQAKSIQTVKSWSSYCSCWWCVHGGKGRKQPIRQAAFLLMYYQLSFLLDIISARKVEGKLKPEWWIFWTIFLCALLIDYIQCDSLRWWYN